MSVSSSAGDVSASVCHLFGLSVYLSLVYIFYLSAMDPSRGEPVWLTWC